jgi:hypothetical protein
MAILISAYLFSMPKGAAKHHEIMMKPIRPGELIGTVQGIIGKAEV